METIHLERTAELKRTKEKLEKELNVKIKITGKNITLDGETLDEYEAVKIIDAINFGFSTENALLLKEQDYAFRKIHIKEFTKRPLESIRSRLIGKHGKTRITKTPGNIRGIRGL